MPIDEIKIKSMDELHLAHDTLYAILHGEMKEAFLRVHMNHDTVISLVTAHEVLGWVIGCPCGKEFQSNLDEIQEVAQRLGFRVNKNENQ